MAAPATMRAVLSVRRGGPETLEMRTVPVPRPAAGQVLIRVHACSLNYPDVLVIEDRYQLKPPRPFSPGIEVAGEVAEVGAGVTGLTPGTRVIGLLGHGGLAEYALAPAVRCVAIPATMPYDDAAALLTTYGTAWHALRQRAHLSSGESLLVLGAAGGVGLATVELGAALGARVTAAASSAAKVALAAQHGAAATLVYPADPGALPPPELSALFKRAGGETGFDVICDPVGGAYAAAACRALAYEGRFLIVGFPAGIPGIPLNLPLLKGAALIGVYYGEFIDRRPLQHEQNTRELLDLYQRGVIRPVISERHTFDAAAAAFATMSARGALGKIVLTP